MDKPSRLRQLQNGSMQPLMILKLLILLAVANGTPVLAKNAARRPSCSPARWRRGLCRWPAAVWAHQDHPRDSSSRSLATPLAAWLIGLSWQLGVVVAALAIAGDLLSSFVKRRMGLASSSMAIGLDQIPESLLPLLASRLLLPFSLARCRWSAWRSSSSASSSSRASCSISTCATGPIDGGASARIGEGGAG